MTERLKYMVPENLKSFENSEEIKIAQEVVIGFLANNPPEVGHGYSHLKKVARESYLMGQKKGVERLDLLYISGLCHDIYRPSDGEGAKEDHEERCGEITRELFTSIIPSDDLNTVIETIVNHDKLITENRSNEMMKVLSIADKKDMSAQRWMGYAWANNKNKKREERSYQKFSDVLAAFKKYRGKAFKVFGILPEDDIQEALTTYFDTDLEISILIEQEKKGKIKFEDIYLRMAENEAKKDWKYLMMDDVDKETAKQVTNKYSQLLDN